MKRATALLLSFILIFGMITPSAYADNSEAHWAAEELEKWQDYEVINGYEDLDLKPNQEITRAEMAQIVYNLFGYDKVDTVNSFSDVTDEQWFSVAIEKGLEAGYLEMGNEGKFYPNKDLSRSEAAVILYDAFRMTEENQLVDSENILKDIDSLNEETKNKVSFMVSKGYINGYPDGTFKGSDTITRGEIITIVDRIVDIYVNKDEMILEDEITGNILVVSEDVSIKDSILDGTLFVSEAIGESDLLVENSEVKGNLVIEGGGNESVHLKNSIFTSVIGNKKSGNPLRISVEGNTIIENLFIQNGMILENSSSNSQIKKVLIDKNVTSEDLVNIVGEFNSLEINSDGAKLKLIGSIKNLVNNGNNSINDKKYGKGRFGSVAPANETATRKASPSSNVSPWTIVWRDEFSGDTLDTSKWKYETGNWIVDESGVGISPGWGNNEKQYYTDSEENIYLENGKLVLKAKVEETSDEFGTYEYTSGKLVTNGLFNKKYGKIQAKMKLPKGQGLWPAFWMMPQDSVYGDWAASGEIDIMEAGGSKPNQVGGTIHYGDVWPNNTYSGEEYHFSQGEDITDFHVYEIEWEPGEIRWYVDGKHYSTKNNWYSRGEGQTLEYSYPAPFDQEFYMILNLAVGGWYDGDPADESVIPASVLVDYVRVYELTGREYREPEVPDFEPEAIPENGKLPLEDGNLVYNNNYDGTQLGNIDLETVYDGIYLDGIEGLDQTDFWYLVNGFNGDGSVSIDKTNEATNYAKVDISAGGDQNYAVQLMQDISLATGNYYKLSFDAKSTSNRNIAVKIGGDENDGWTAYTTKDFSLSTDFESFEHTFQMTEETDLDTRLEFNLGLNTNNVWLGNVRVEAIEPPEVDFDASKEPLESGNRVYNGTFDQGDPSRFNYWNLETTDANASPIVDEESRNLLVDISEGGTASDSIVLNQKGIQLEEDYEYTLTFDVFGEADKDIDVEIISADGSISYLETTTLGVSTTNTSKEVKFVMDEEKDLNSELRFKLGSDSSNVIFDNITLMGSKIDKGYTDYSLEPITFDSSEDSLESWWGDQWSGNADGTTAVNQGLFEIDLTSLGHASYSAQVFEEGFELENGKTYQLSFDAKADAAKTINVNLGKALDSDPWFTNYIPTQTYVLSDSLKTYNYTFTVDEATDDNLKVVFELGTVNGDGTVGKVSLDNIYVKEVCEPSIVNYSLEPMTFDSSDETLESWWGDQWSGYSSGTVVTTSGAIEVEVTTAAAVSYSPQVFKEGISLENGKTYQLSFDAKADTNKTINVNLGKALDADPYFTNYMPTMTYVIKDTNQTYNYTFTVDEATDDNLKLVFELGTVNGDGTIGKVTFDNISVKEIPVLKYSLEPITFDSSGDSLESWWGDQWSGNADGTTAVNQGLFEIDLTSLGHASYSAQVFEEGFELENGKTYQLSFDAKADAAKTINVNLGKALDSDPWFTNYIPTQTYVLSDSLKTYNYTFTVDEATDDNLKVVFELGTVNGDGTVGKVSLDNISVEEVYNSFDIEYSLEPMTFDSSEETLKSWWGDDGAGYANGTVVTTSGAIEVELTTLGSVSYSPQVFKEGIALENGKTYQLSFDAISDEYKTINVNLGEGLDHAPWFTNYMPTMTYVIKDTNQTYNYTFTVDEATDDNLKLVFELGTVNGDGTMGKVTFDNISVEEVINCD